VQQAVVAFVGSFAVSLVLIGAVLAYSKRRPAGSPVTWGEAMVASVFVFFCFFWAYGVVPQTWILYSANELKMSPDHIIIGHGGTLLDGGPVKFSLGGLADIITTVIYGFYLTASIALFIIWNKRGKTQEEARRKQLVRGGASGRRALARQGQSS
jgi:hypothetical protein